MARRIAPKHQPFESHTDKGRFTKICNDMMNSAAWQELNMRQRALYLELKSKYTAKTSCGLLISDNHRNISIPSNEARKLYGDLRTFRSDIDKLIECGLIDLVESGWTTRTCNIYGFSDRWKKYGLPDYKVPLQNQRQKVKRQNCSLPTK